MESDGSSGSDSAVGGGETGGNGGTGAQAGAGSAPPSRGTTGSAGSTSGALDDGGPLDDAGTFIDNCGQTEMPTNNNRDHTTPIALGSTMLKWQAGVEYFNQEYNQDATNTLSAFVLSLLFFVSYITRMVMFGDNRFDGSQQLRPVYYFILASHVSLAIAVAPFVVYSVSLGLRDKRERHRRLVRKVLPMIEKELSTYQVRPHWGKLFAVNPAELQSRYEKVTELKICSGSTIHAGSSGMSS